jgi:hypothetical protein
MSSGNSTRAVPSSVVYALIESMWAYSLYRRSSCDGGRGRAREVSVAASVCSANGASSEVCRGSVGPPAFILSR